MLFRSRAAQPLKITWFEEPLSRTDYDGYAQLRRQAGMSIATGEREFDTVTLRELIRRDQDRQTLRGLLLEGVGSEPGEAADASDFARLRARVTGRAEG